MADRSHEPASFRLDELRDLFPDDEMHQAMCDSIEKAAPGAEVLLPHPDGSRTRYTWDGRELLHRSDTKAGQVLRSRAGGMVPKHG